MSGYGHAGLASFAGVQFDIEGGDGALTDFAAGTNYAAEDVNYGSKTYVQVLGPKSGEVTLQLVLPVAAWTTLKTKLRQQGQLQTASGYARSALLLGWDPARVSLAGGFARALVRWYV